MQIVRYRWEPENVFEMVFVRGTNGHPFRFDYRDGCIGFRLAVSIDLPRDS